MFRLGIIAFLAASIAAVIPIPKPLDRQQERHSSAASQQSAPNERGTNEAPLVVKVLPASKTKQEAADEKADRADQSNANWWMVRLTGVLAFIGLLQTIVFGRQAYRLKQTIDKMDEIAAGQTADMQTSIGAATRAATAMEGVATSMAANVESVRQSVQTSKEIANAQREFWHKQMRAYVSIVYIETIHQDITNNYHFEIRLAAVNNGLTPGHDVTYWAKVDILPFPLPNDYKLPDGKGDNLSAGVIGPRQNYTLSAFAPNMYAVPDVVAIKQSAGKRLYIWGTLTYKDIAGEPRYVNFCQSVAWYQKGTMGVNANQHNDAN